MGITSRQMSFLFLCVVATCVQGFAPLSKQGLSNRVVPSTELEAFFTKEKKVESSSPAKKVGMTNPFASFGWKAPVKRASPGLKKASANKIVAKVAKSKVSKASAAPKVKKVIA